MDTFEIDERLEILRDALRQAAVHSPNQKTRWAADAALAQTSPLALVRVTRHLSCQYAPKLRPLIDDFLGARHG